MNLLLSLQLSAHNSYSKSLKPHSNTPPPTLTRRLHLTMKERTPNSYGTLYVPPHQRFHSGISTADSRPSNSTASEPRNGNSFATLKVSTKSDDSSKDNANSYPYLPPHRQFQQQRKSPATDEGLDRPFEYSAQLGDSLSENAIEWKWKLNTLLQGEDKQEIVSREKKDRRDFEQIAAIANKMGLY